MTICWDCRQRDGSHLKDCSERLRSAYSCRVPFDHPSVDYVQRWSVLSDDDVAWCREQLAARHAR